VRASVAPHFRTDLEDDMTKVREIMSKGAEHLTVDSTVDEAVDCMRRNDIGAVPVCSTDRDLALRVLAEARDPKSVDLGSIIQQDEVVTIGADDSIEELVKTMSEHKVRRVPVIDGREMVGMVSQADLARNCPPELVKEFVAAVSSTP
jgi:CBS domain-containing protein